MRSNIPNLLTILAVVVIAGCAGKGAGPEKTAEELTAEGWEVYKGQTYEEVLDLFNQAVEKNPGYPEAYNGLGWANAKLNRLSAAVTNFSQCLSLDHQNLNAKAGLAFVYNAQNRYSESVIEAKEVLEVDPGWVFPYDSTLDSGDLHLLLAQDYYAQAEFEKSLAEVRVLNGEFTAAVNTPEGRTDLAAEIERLREEV